MKFFNAYRKYVLMDAAPGESGGTNPQPAPKPEPSPKPTNEVESLKNQNAELIKRLEALEARNQQPEPKPDLSDRARNQREELDKKNSDQKRITNAVKFTMGSQDWLKNNATLLPKTVPDLFVHAERETYNSEIEKADAIKVGIVNEFFAIQSNLDLLTDTQKNMLDDWKNLTKTDKQERIQNVYDLVFEPSFERLRGQRKAEHLAKGTNESTHSEDAYKKRLMEISRKHYLGEK